MTASRTETAEYKDLDHRGALELWGEPDEQEGSVNDPRTREEHGVRFNERWIYLLPDRQRRIVYWHRYNCRGVRVEEYDRHAGAARETSAATAADAAGAPAAGSSEAGG